MKIEINKRIGSSKFVFEVNESKDIDALFKAGTLAAIPSKCMCGSEDVCLEGQKRKGYTFVKVICKKCDAQSQLGQYKDGGFFWKKFEKNDFNKGQSDTGEVEIMKEE